MALAVESHPQRADIIDWLTRGDDPATIATRLRPPLHRATIWRYDRNRREKLQDAAKVPSALVTALQERGCFRDDPDVHAVAQAVATATKSLAAADPYLTRTAQHRQTIDDAIIDAKADKDGRTIAALIGTDLKGLELDARLTGRLDSAAGTNNHIYIVADSISIGVPEQSGPEAKVIDI